MLGLIHGKWTSRPVNSIAGHNKEISHDLIEETEEE